MVLLFPALLLAKELEDRLRRQASPRNGRYPADLDDCRKSSSSRTASASFADPTTGVAGKLFQAVASPAANVQELPLPTSQSPA